MIENIINNNGDDHASPLKQTMSKLLENFAVNILSRKDTVPIFSHIINHSTQRNESNQMHINGIDDNDISKQGGGTTDGDADPEYNSNRYIGVLIGLDVLSFLIVILLAVSANRAYKFMARKDRLLLFNFIFLELSLLCK